MAGWMCPLKREQARRDRANRRVGYDSLTYCRLYCGDIGKKVGHELKIFTCSRRWNCNRSIKTVTRYYAFPLIK